MGQTLGLSSLEETARAIEETLGYPAARVLRGVELDGVVAGREAKASSVVALDPMAFPGVRSADLVGLAPRAGAVGTLDVSEGAWSPSSWTEVTSVSPAHVPQADAYSLRLVATRRL
jgi:hypothetical protein